jgi:hypothetical protein
MGETVFRARKSAGELVIEDADGNVKHLPIRVLDLPTWQEYELYRGEHLAAQSELQEVQEQIKDESIKSTEKRKLISRASELGSQAVKSVYEQMRFFVEIEEDDLIGRDFDQLTQMLEYMVTKASSPGAKIKLVVEGESEDEKKPETEKPEESSH